MGVAGCGKSLVGAALAKAIGARFIEGDALQPSENVARMSRGEPLTDTLRAGWLDAVGQSIRAAMLGGEGAVAACSALKRIYRDRLRRCEPSVVFVYLVVTPREARRRVTGRRGHFMPASLVDSQFATLEPPGADEAALSVGAERPLDEIVAAVVEFLALRRSQLSQ
ncbi:MAG: gluconokinase [Rhizobiaceae bacterium]|nr:gluconokinase [Rhizobiaceae bacterium]